MNTETGLDFISPRTEITVAKQSVSIGAGLHTRRWMVLEDGRVLDSFHAFIDAHTFANRRRMELQGNDE